MNMDEMNNDTMQGGEDQAPATNPSDDEATTAAPAEGMPAEGEAPAAPTEGGESTE